MRGTIISILVLGAVIWGVAYLNPLVKNYAVFRYERDHPEIMIIVSKNDDQVQLFNRGSQAVYSFIELNMAFTDRSGAETEQLAQPVEGLLPPQDTLFFEVPDAMRRKFRQGCTVTIKSALGEQLRQ